MSNVKDTNRQNARLACGTIQLTIKSLAVKKIFFQKHEENFIFALFSKETAAAKNISISCESGNPISRPFLGLFDQEKEGKVR